MNNQQWKDIGIREKMQLFNGTFLVVSAIILYFLAFIITLSIGFEIISAGATLLATGLAFFGITSFVKNQIVDFKAEVNNKLRQMEHYENRYESDTDDTVDSKSLN